MGKCGCGLSKKMPKCDDSCKKIKKAKKTESFFDKFKKKSKHYRVKILVARKAGIKDPQAVTLENTLKRLEVEVEPVVKIGKFFELEITAHKKNEAYQKAEKIAQEFLSNVLLESFEIVEIKKI